MRFTRHTVGARVAALAALCCGGFSLGCPLAILPISRSTLSHLISSRHPPHLRHRIFFKPSATTLTAGRPGVPSDTSSTTLTHTPVWLSVKYRTDRVDVANPRFSYLDTTGSSVLTGAWYDQSNAYLLLGLSGTVYHYCGVPSSTWAGLVGAGSRGSYFNSEIKGGYDCRGGLVPAYHESPSG